MTQHTHQTAPTQLVDAAGVRSAYPLLPRIRTKGQFTPGAAASCSPQIVGAYVHIRFDSFHYGHIHIICHRCEHRDLPP
jgi:hypothetical protein